MDPLAFVYGLALIVLVVVLGRLSRRRSARWPWRWPVLRDHGEWAGQNLWFRRWVVPVLVLMLLLGGWWEVQLFGERVENAQREELLSQVVGIAGAIGTEEIRGLSFTAEDKGTPVFRRLRSNMTAYAQLLDVRGLYSMGLRDGRVIFGPESYPDGDPQASPAGTPYARPPAELREVFQAGRATTAGPYTDEYGTFVSGFAPVLDPLTGKVLVVIAADVEATSLQKAVARARLLPIVFTAAMLVLMLCGVILLGIRDRLAPGRQVRLRHAETILTAAIGFMLTLAIARIAHMASEDDRLRVFSDLARAKAGAVVQELRDALGREHDLVRFFESSHEVDRQEFHHFTESVTYDFVRAWQWIPRVTAPEVSALEERARSEGRPAFAVWQVNRRGMVEPAAGRDAYFPVLYTEPASAGDEVLGYDEGSDPARRAVLDEMARTGMATAIDPVPPRRGAEAGQSLLVYQPVFRHDEKPPRLCGFIGATVQLDRVLSHGVPSSGGEASHVAVELFRIEAGTAPRLLASMPPDDTAPRAAPTEWWRTASLNGAVILPLFIFGRSHAIVAHPQSPSSLQGASHRGWLVGGVVLTAMLSGFVAFLVNRGIVLERQVKERTGELHKRLDSFRRQFTENSAIMVLVDPSDGRICDCNEAALRFYGYPRGQFVGMAVTEINRLPRQSVLEAMASVPDTHGVRFEFQHHVADGSMRQVEVFSSRILFDERPMLHSIIVDITERKHAEAQLRENEANFRTFFESMDDLIFVATPQGRLIYTNPAASRKLEYSPADLGSMQVIDLHPPDKRPEAETIFAAMARGERDHCPLPLLTASGACIPVETRVWAGRWNGEDCLFGISKDLSAQVAALQKFNRLFSGNPALMAVSSVPDQKFTEVNEAFLSRLGYSREEVIGTTAHDLGLFVQPEQQLEVARQLRQTGRLSHCLLDVKTKRGAILDGLFYGEIIDNQGQQSFLTVMIDLTEQKRAEAALRASKLELEEANQRLELAVAEAHMMAARADLASRAKSEFLANMSHEIRTPMNSVIGMTELLLETGLAGEQRLYAETVQTSGEALLQIINDILDISKIEAGKLALETLDFDLRSMLDDFARMMAVKAAEKGLELTCAVGAEVPAALQGDPGRLRQILTNLVGNALKFTHRGEVAIRVRLESEDQRVALLRFSVRDTGIGIAEEKVGGLFEKFTQVDASTTRTYGGTGLGLAISRQLVQMMGGTIGVNTREGEGSEFWFTTCFELQPDERRKRPSPGLHPEHESALAPLSPGCTLPEPGAAGSPWPLGTRVLVAEDSVTNQMVAVGFLKRLGVATDVVTNGHEVLEALARVPYCLVLMDVQMPEMDGLEATRAIRDPLATVLDPQVPIIGLTAHAMAGDRENCLQAGMNDYVSKPIDPRILRAVLERWLPRGERDSRLEASPPLAPGH